jgi:hypothetical protein
VNALLDPVKSVTTAPVLADNQSMGNILQTAMEKNKMRKHIGIFFVGFMIVIVSCAVKAETSPTSMSTRPIDMITYFMVRRLRQQQSYSPLLHNLHRPYIFYSTLTPSITLSPTPVSNIIEKCLEIQQNLPVGHTYTGTVAFENGFGFRNGVPIKDNISLYNIQTEKVTFTDTGLFSSVSPNHTLFAYHNLEDRRRYRCEGSQINRLGKTGVCRALAGRPEYSASMAGLGITWWLKYPPMFYLIRSLAKIGLAGRLSTLIQIQPGPFGSGPDHLLRCIPLILSGLYTQGASMLVARMLLEDICYMEFLRRASWPRFPIAIG